MQFTIVDTEAAYRRLLAAPDAAREAIFRAELVAPFEGLVRAFGGGDGLAMFRAWKLAPDNSRAPVDWVAAALDRYRLRRGGGGRNHWRRAQGVRSLLDRTR